MGLLGYQLLQELVGELSDCKAGNQACVSDSSINSLQQPLGIVTVETQLLPTRNSESYAPARKRARTSRTVDQREDNSLSWLELIRYVCCEDVVHTPLKH